MPTQALIVSGGGRFTDPWHPFADTSGALAEALRARGCQVEVSSDADSCLATLDVNALPSLLVMNFGWYGAERLDEAATEGLTAALNAGLPTLMVHSTLTAFPDWPLWREVAGGGWTQGTTYHPAYGPGVALADPDHALSSGLEQLSVRDERYTRLWVDETSAVFLQHEEKGRRHPLGWTRTWGASPIVADALGHDADSYRAEGRLTLLDRELDYLGISAKPGGD